MLFTAKGVYRDGKVELLDDAPDTKECRVIVTFLDESWPIDLRSRGIDEAQAANLRWRLQCFAEDWDSPEMDIYDAP